MVVAVNVRKNIFPGPLDVAVEVILEPIVESAYREGMAKDGI